MDEANESTSGTISRRVAIVTGSSSGLGQALSHHLLTEGWKVAGFDISKDTSTSLKDDFGDGFEHYDVNVADYDSQAAAFSAIWERWGRIDALCANAGVIDRQSIYLFGHRGKTELPPKPDLSCTDIDYKGLVYGTQLAIHFMRQNSHGAGGAIVATSSICGVHPIESLPEYSGAKAAVIGFARATAPILKSKDNITMNVICPGCLPTPAIPPFMVEAFGSNMTTFENVLSAYTSCLNDQNINGQIVECAAQQQYIITKPPFNSDASRMAGTVYEPLFQAVHGKGSGLAWSQGVHPDQREGRKD